MPRPFRFPRNPGTERPDPFVDKQGNNPFADTPGPDTPAPNAPVDETGGDPDATTASRAAESSVFATPGAERSRSRQVDYQPEGYVRTLPHRAGTILTLGIVGLIGTIVGGLGALASFAVGSSFEAIVFMSGLAPFALFSLAASVPCWMMGGYDIRAMRAGAMDTSGQTKTRIGLYLGIAATTFSVGLMALVVAGIVNAFLDFLRNF